MLPIRLREITKYSNMVANFLLTYPHTPLGQKVKIQLFQNMVMLHTKLDGFMKCSNMVENILPADPPSPLNLGFGSKGQISTFKEHCHVAYQIKWNHKCSDMVATFCLQTPIPDPGDGVKIQFLRKWSCCISN